LKVAEPAVGTDDDISFVEIGFAVKSEVENIAGSEGEVLLPRGARGGSRIPMD